MMSLLTNLVPLEGWVILGFCLFLYWLSPMTQGARSLAHVLLFNDLIVLNPTEQSVALIAGVPGGHPTAAGVRKPKTKPDRLAALQLTSRKLQSGMVAVAAIKKKHHRTTKLWRIMEALFVLILGSFLGLTLRWTRLFFDSIASPPCCVDFPCWETLFHKLQKYIPWMAILSLWLITYILEISLLTSQLPPTSPLRYPPASYVTGWVMGLTALWMSNTPRLLTNLGISLIQSHQELAVRTILLCRVLGIKVQEQEDAVDSLAEWIKWLTAFAIGYVGFALSDPLATYVKLVLYRLVAGVSMKTNNPTTSNDTLSNYQILGALALLGVLPILILLSYFYNFSDVRVFTGWLLLVTMLFTIKPLLQTHLEQSLPAVSAIFGNKDVTVDAIQFPFKNRQERLIPVAGQLAVFPALIIAFLTLQHLSQQPIPLSVYPVAFGGDLRETSVHSFYRQSQALHTMKSSALRKKGSSWFVSLLLPSIIVSPISANSCAELDDDDPKKSDRQKKRGAGVTTIPPATARDLLQRAPTLESTLAKEFGKWQTSLKKEQQQQQQQQSSSSSSSSSPRENRHQSSQQESAMRGLFGAVWDHPWLTPTIVLPLLDFFLFCYCLLWTFSLAMGFLSIGKIRKELGLFSYGIEREEKNE